MTMRSKEKLICECGFVGYLCLSENDQPYSSLREDYRLEGFSGGYLHLTSYADMPSDLLKHLKPRCPECNQVGKVNYAKRPQRPEAPR